MSWSSCSPLRHDPDAAFRTAVQMGENRATGDAARGQGRARLWAGDRLPRRADHSGLVLRACVSLGLAWSSKTGTRRSR